MAVLEAGKYLPKVEVWAKPTQYCMILHSRFRRRAFCVDFLPFLISRRPRYIAVIATATAAVVVMVLCAALTAQPSPFIHPSLPQLLLLQRL